MMNDSFNWSLSVSFFNQCNSTVNFYEIGILKVIKSLDFNKAHQFRSLQNIFFLHVISILLDCRITNLGNLKFT